VVAAGNKPGLDSHCLLQPPSLEKPTLQLVV